MSKVRVGVLMGGKSIEKEVSFNSGRTVCDHLDPAIYDIVPLFQRPDGALFILPWKFVHRGKITDFLDKLETDAQPIMWDELAGRVDIIFIATHGRYAEDGTLQGMLTVLGIPYLGSGVFASALSMDKVVQKTFLRNAGIQVARDVVVLPTQSTQIDQGIVQLCAQLEVAQIEFPVVVKPHKEGSSLGVTVVHRPEQLADAIKRASFVTPGFPQAVLIEERIVGMEFSCIVLTDRATGQPLPLPPTEIVPEQGSDLFDYEQKYMPGRATKYTPARVSDALLQKIQETCVATMQALEFETMARIDGFVTLDDQVVIVDPNTLSGMAPSSFLFREAAEIGMGHSDLINYLIAGELAAADVGEGAFGRAASSKNTQGEQMNDQPKTRVAVLLGGRSNEREISLESGRNVVYKLSPHRYEVTPVFVDHALALYPISQSVLVRNSTKEIEELVHSNDAITWQSLKDCFDFVFLGLHGGEGEDGTVQGALEMLGIPYNGSSVLASGLCMDKYKTSEYLAQHGCDVPQHCLIKKEAWVADEQACLAQIAVLDFPVILKPHNDGCSVGVQMVQEWGQLSHVLGAYFEQREMVLVEEYIRGTELTVGVLGNEDPLVLPATQAVSSAGVLSIQEKFLPGEGENLTPAPLPAAAHELITYAVEHAYRVIGCAGYARIDCFYQDAQESPTGEPRVVILEVNTLPALTPATCLFHQAAEVGIRPMELLDRIVSLGQEAHGSHVADVRMSNRAVERDG